MISSKWFLESLWRASRARLMSQQGLFRGLQVFRQVPDNLLLLR